MTRPRLHIGDRNYSSWSMRPWLALRHGGIAFDEVLHALPEMGGKPSFGAISPNARVPALDLGDGVVVAGFNPSTSRTLGGCAPANGAAHSAPTPAIAPSTRRRDQSLLFITSQPVAVPSNAGPASSVKHPASSTGDSSGSP